MQNDFEVLSKIDSVHVVWLKGFVKSLPRRRQDALCRALLTRAHPSVGVPDKEAESELQELLATTDRIPFVESHGSTALLKGYLEQDLSKICTVPIMWVGSHCTTEAAVGDLKFKIELDLGGRWSRAAFFTHAFLKDQLVEWMQTSILQWIGLTAETVWQGQAKEQDLSQRLSDVLATWIELQSRVLT